MRLFRNVQSSAFPAAKGSEMEVYMKDLVKIVLLAINGGAWGEAFALHEDSPRFQSNSQMNGGHERP